MKTLLMALAAAILLGSASVSPAVGSDAAAPGALASAAPGMGSAPITSATIPAYLDEDLASKFADFSRFAKSWIRTSNQHCISSKSRMQVKKEADGTYSATYQSSDETDLVCTVKKSTSGAYTAVLRYKEILYRAIAASPEACRNGEFLPSLVNRRIRIFKLKGNTWE